MFDFSSDATIWGDFWTRVPVIEKSMNCLLQLCNKEFLEWSSTYAFKC
jgi:hypothetical protein